MNNMGFSKLESNEMMPSKILEEFQQTKLSFKCEGASRRATSCKSYLWSFPCQRSYWKISCVKTKEHTFPSSMGSVEVEWF